MLCSATLFVGASFGHSVFCLFMSCCEVCMCEDGLTRLYI